MNKHIYTGLLLLLIISALPVQSQTNDGLYHMWGMPQASRLNPALNPISGFYAGFGVNLKLENSLIQTSDALQYDPDAQETMTILGSSQMQNDFLNKMNKTGIIGTSFNSPWQVGFRVNNLYLGFEFGVNTYVNSLFPEDLFAFVIRGNAQQSLFDFGGLGADAMLYSDLSIRTAYDISDRLTIGMRNKILIGHAYASTANSEITIQSDYDKIIFDTDIEMQMASSNIFIENFGVSPTVLDTMEFNFIDDYSLNTLMQNKGFGIDIGANFKINEMFEVSASVTDFGFIAWSKGVYNIHQNSELSFLGFNFDSAAFDQANMAAFADSLKDDLYMTFDDKGFRTWLPTKVYLGGRFDLNNKFSVGLLSRTTFFKQQLYESITGSVNYYPFQRTPSLTVAYTYNNQYHDKITIGWMSRLGSVLLPLSLLNYPLYMHFMFDIPMTYMYDDTLLEHKGGDTMEKVAKIAVVNKVIRPDTKVPIPQLSGITFMWSLYMRLGFNKDKKMKKDEPLLYF